MGIIQRSGYCHGIAIPVDHVEVGGLLLSCGTGLPGRISVLGVARSGVVVAHALFQVKHPW